MFTRPLETSLSSIIRCAILCAITGAAAASAQDVLHYKFDAGGGRKVINYAARSGIAPPEGVIQHRSGPLPPLWAAGRFGSALAGDPLGSTPRIQIDTGWGGAFNDSFTIAAFLKLRTPISPTANFSFVRTTYFTVALRGRNSNGNLAVWWPSRAVQSTTDVNALVAMGWVHVAVVVDGGTKFATFYIDGKPELPQRFSGTVPVNGDVNNLRVGTIDSSGSLDIDEFRFRLGTATATEVKAWASENPAADGTYGQGCWPKGRPVLLDSNADKHGPPTIGNARYAFELYGLPGSSFVFVLGTNRLRYGALPLPLDLGFLDPALKGCDWETSADLAWLPGAIGPTGKAVLAAPLPNNPALNGITVYAQAVLYSGSLQRWMASNAFATAIGK